MWCTQVNTLLPRNPYFPPVGRPPAGSCCSGSGVRFCLADELNVPWGWSWRAVLLVRTGCQAEIVYIRNHHDWCSLSFPPPFLSPQLLPSIINRVPGLPRHNRNSSSSSSLSSSSCFPVPSLESPPTQRWQIHPACAWDARRHNTSTWQTSRRVLVATQRRTGITMNDSTA